MAYTPLRMGEVTLVAGVATVPCVHVKATSKFFLSRKTGAGVLGDLKVTTITPGESFVINTGNVLDTSVVHWMCVDA